MQNAGRAARDLRENIEPFGGGFLRNLEHAPAFVCGG